MQAREGVGRRGRETEKAGRQTGIRTKGGEESGRKYQLRTQKKKKKRNKRCAKRRSTRKYRNGRGEKLQTRSRISIVFGSSEEKEERSFFGKLLHGEVD